MKSVALLLSLCLTLNVFAASAGQLQLERELDEYNYVLSVEWDQKDKKFYEAETAKFLKKLSHLMGEQGLTPKDLILLCEKKIKNKEVLDAIKLRLRILGPAAMEADLLKIIKDTSGEFYAKGASWDGQVIFLYAAGLALVAGFAYAIWFAATHECTETVEQYQCNTTSQTGYDGTVINNTVCGPTAVCVAYKRR